MKGVTSLGVILADNMDPACQRPMEDNERMWMYETMDDFTAAQQSEGEITKAERARAQALEAILMDEGISNVIHTKEEIRDAIKALHTWAPIEVKNGVPASLDDLKTLIDRLMTLDMEKDPITNTELSLILEKIVQYYHEENSVSSFPINIGIFQQIEAHIEDMDELTPQDWFTNRDPMEPAKTDDLILLLESVSTHY